MPAHAANALAEALQPLLEAPRQAAVFCDIDGTLAPIVARPEAARVPPETARLLAGLGRRYLCVACVSGRGAAEARRLVGVGAITYVGAHGAERLDPGVNRPTVVPAFAAEAEQVRGFAFAIPQDELRQLALLREDKGAIVAFHWRDARDEGAARARAEEIAREAERAGLIAHWGRKVLEVRPPTPVDKGQAVTELVRSSGARTALFGGDDTTDLDAFAALEALASAGELDARVRVGVRSEEGPPAIQERADLVVDGVPGFAAVLASLAGR